MAPAVIHRGFQQDGGPRGQDATDQEQALETQPRIAQQGSRAAPRAPRQGRQADQTEAERERRRGDREPAGYVLRRQRLAAAVEVMSAEQLGHIEGVVSRVRERFREMADRIAPQIGEEGVQRQGARRREHAARAQDAPPRRAVGGPEEVAEAQRQHGGAEQEAHGPYVGQHPDAGAAQQEGGPRAAAEGPVREQQRQHEQAEEGQVLGVEEGVRVQARVQQEQAQRRQRQPPAAVQAEGQRGRAQAAGQKEQMRQQVAQEVDGAAVLQAQRALRPQQRRFHRDPVHAILVAQQLVVAAPDVIQSELRGTALHALVCMHAVIVQHRHPREQEERAGQPRAARRRPVRDGAQRSGCPRITRRNIMEAGHAVRGVIPV